MNHIRVTRTVEVQTVTVGDVRYWLKILDSFGVPDDTELLDAPDLAVTFEDRTVTLTLEEEEADGNS